MGRMRTIDCTPQTSQLDLEVEIKKTRKGGKEKKPKKKRAQKGIRET